MVALHSLMGGCVTSLEGSLLVWEISPTSAGLVDLVLVWSWEQAQLELRVPATPTSVLHQPVSHLF